ncbi:MAG: polysaccharide deacetylase family protein [Anaerolineae bacterium]|nr:polysaccharide deacetylase family protein [Anaerolineae bacterium]
MMSDLARSATLWFETGSGLIDNEQRAILAIDTWPVPDEALRCTSSFKKQMTRLLFSDVLHRLPYSAYRTVTDVVKRLRGVSGTRLPPVLSTSELVERQMGLAQKAKMTRTRICLTHDIDTRIGHDFWHRAIEVEQKYGLYSTSNVLTDGPYNLDLDWLEQIKRQGFEIGLHGDFHDLASGYRRREVLKGRLQRSLDVLGGQVDGYRAPGLSISERSMSVLQELGFKYDSSLTTNLFYTKGLELYQPYLYPSINLWELPLTVQDDGLFRDRNLSEVQAVDLLKTIVHLLGTVGGLFVINTHPSILQSRLSYYDEWLGWLVEQQVEVLLARDLVSSLNEQILTV